MKIETKYNIGDKVFILDDGEYINIYQGIIKEIFIECRPNEINIVYIIEYSESDEGEEFTEKYVYMTIKEIDQILKDGENV